MRINILRKGDTVINVNRDFISVRRENGEVDLVPLIIDESGLRIDKTNIVTIGYGNNTVSTDLDNDVTIINYQ